MARPWKMGRTSQSSASAMTPAAMGTGLGGRRGPPKAAGGGCPGGGGGGGGGGAARRPPLREGGGGGAAAPAGSVARMHEAKIEETEAGRVPADDGWFILNVAEIGWATVP